MTTEFDLIAQLTQGFQKSDDRVVVPIGDDAAVLKRGELYDVIAADTLVEGDHFNPNWSTPAQVGHKAAESNLSDMAAMGAVPKYALVCAVLRNAADRAWLAAVYGGIRASFKKHGVVLLGGDTTHGPCRVLSLTIVGEATKARLTTRGGARAGDAICVTGQVGGSAAGYFSLKAGREIDAYLAKRHLTPSCRLDISAAIADVATAMIDVSDGVGSEVRHLCDHSGTGAVIRYGALPIAPSVHAAEASLNLKQGTCALSGGEDFELLFTCREGDAKALIEKGLDVSIIGHMTDQKDQRDIVWGDGSVSKIPHGWDHTNALDAA